MLQSKLPGMSSCFVPVLSTVPVLGGHCDWGLRSHQENEPSGHLAARLVCPRAELAKQLGLWPVPLESSATSAAGSSGDNCHE